MSNDPNNAQATSKELDLYLDGLLNEADRKKFEAAMAADPALRAQRDLQLNIDGALGALFAPPEKGSRGEGEKGRRGDLSPCLLVSLSPGLPVSPSPGLLVSRSRFDGLRRSPWLAIAALLLIALSTWRIWDTFHSTQQVADKTPYVGPTWQTVEMAYTQKVNTGFKPDWVCENDKQLAIATWDVLGHALGHEDLPAGVELAGLCYANVNSPTTIMVLARSQNVPIIIFVDKTTNPKALFLSPTSKLHVYTRQVGPLYFQEVSTLPAPHLLNAFSELPMPPEWIQEWKTNPKLHFPIPGHVPLGGNPNG